MQQIDMSNEKPMGIAGNSPRVRYSAAYPTGRELMLEPRYGCAGEAMLRREAARSAPDGTARGRARAYRERVFFTMGADPIVFRLLSSECTGGQR